MCLSWNNTYIFYFTYPLRCLRVPPGVRVPQVETTAIDNQIIQIVKHEFKFDIRKNLVQQRSENLGICSYSRWHSDILIQIPFSRECRKRLRSLRQAIVVVGRIEVKRSEYFSRLKPMKTRMYVRQRYRLNLNLLIERAIAYHRAKSILPLGYQEHRARIPRCRWALDVLAQHLHLRGRYIIKPL
jgi:hypothetical protein